MSDAPRIGPDGAPAVDVEVNPKAAERHEREAAERVVAEAKAKAREATHWTRAMVEEVIEEVKARGVIGTINGQELRGLVNLNGKNLDGEDLSGLDLENMNGHGGSFRGTRFVGSNLKGAIFHGAALGGEIAGRDGANFSDANLEGAVFCEACICRCIFHGPKLNASKANFTVRCCEALDGVMLREIKVKDPDGDVVRRLVGDDRFDRCNWAGAVRRHKS